MRSGSGGASAPVHAQHTVDVDHAARDIREQLTGVEAGNIISAMTNVFQITAVAFSTFLNRLARSPFFSSRGTQERRADLRELPEWLLWSCTASRLGEAPVAKTVGLKTQSGYDVRRNRLV